LFKIVQVLPSIDTERSLESRPYPCILSIYPPVTYPS